MRSGRWKGVLAAVGAAFGLCACEFMGLTTGEEDDAAELSVSADEIRLEEQAPAAMGFDVVGDTGEIHVGPTEPEPEPTPEPVSVSEDAVAEEGVSGNSASENMATYAAAAGSYDLTALKKMNFTEEQMAEILAYYDGAVFAGDSVLLGFRNYAAKSSDGFLKSLKFLAAGSFSLHNAFWPVSDKSVHPLYQGEQHPVWESLQMMEARKAFLFFGINDVSLGMDESISLYPQLIDKIKELSPDIEITIISATYTLKDAGTRGLNNTNLAAFNEAIRAKAEENGWGYIDMATVLSDGEGNLAAQYCSDGFVHETAAAYEVWTQMLIRYAADQLGYETPGMDEILVAPEPTEEAVSENEAAESNGEPENVNEENTQEVQEETEPAEETAEETAVQ